MKSSLTRLQDLDCRFLVAGRLVDTRFVTLADLVLPDSFESLFVELPAEHFRLDISSTALRQQHASGSSGTRPLFVFGTLRRGECNHMLLDGHYDQMLPAKLNGYQHVHELMIRRSPGGTVAGEVFFLRDDVYTSTLADCDDLEGISPGQLRGKWYERREVVVETDLGSIRAWAYVEPDEI